MPAASVHWLKTYSDYHKMTLKMLQTNTYPRLMVRKTGNAHKGIIWIWVDDTICGATMEFARKEERAPQDFPSRGRVQIGEEGETFNGVELSLTENK